MKKLLVSMVLALDCSSPETGVTSGSSTGGEQGRPCLTAKDCAIPADPCAAPMCADGVCSTRAVPEGNGCSLPGGRHGLCVGGACLAPSCATGCNDGDPCTADACDTKGTCHNTTAIPRACDDGKGWCNPPQRTDGRIECCHGCLQNDGAVFACAPVCPAPTSCSAQGLCVVQ